MIMDIFLSKNDDILCTKGPPSKWKGQMATRMLLRFFLLPETKKPFLKISYQRREKVKLSLFRYYQNKGNNK